MQLQSAQNDMAQMRIISLFCAIASIPHCSGRRVPQAPGKRPHYARLVEDPRPEWGKRDPKREIIGKMRDQCKEK